MFSLRQWLLVLFLLGLQYGVFSKEGTKPNLFLQILEGADFIRNRATDKISAVEEIPPRPLQVYEYGPSSREEYRRNKKYYKYQYVCLMDGEGMATWHKRRMPLFWRGKKPPFHVRIVRPNLAGMLYFLLSNDKIRVDWVEEEVTMDNGKVQKCFVHKIVPL